jgi:hypothetical protein
MNPEITSARTIIRPLRRFDLPIIWRRPLHISGEISRRPDGVLVRLVNGVHIPINPSDRVSAAGTVKFD